MALMTGVSTPLHATTLTTMITSFNMLPTKEGRYAVPFITLTMMTAKYSPHYSSDDGDVHPSLS